MNNYAKVKVYSLIQREFAYSTQTDTQGKYIPYFQDNNSFPNILADLVAGSPTATSCLSTMTDFIAGEGFNQGKELEAFVLNKQGLTFSQFHNVCSDTMAHEWGVASLIKYNKAGGITEVYDIPFGYCRLGLPDSKGVISKIKYNPYFGTSLYRQQDTEEYDVFNPSAAPVQFAKDKNWKGQIYWLGIKTRKHPFYPIPDYFSAAPWMRVEKNAGIYFDENLENGFLQDIAIKMIGDPNDPSGIKDSAGEDIPKAKAFDMEMTNNFGKGAKTRHKLIAFWENNKEEWPVLEAIPSSGNPDLFRVQDEHAIKKITIATKVPAILANISEGVSLGGDGNTIRASVKLMQQRVVRMQSLLVFYYENILKAWQQPRTEPIEITAYHPFPELEVVDPQIWEQLTTEEKRKWIADKSEVELIETAPPATPPTEARAVALHFNSYPEAARKSVKRALEWQAEKGIKCIKNFGLDLGKSIIEGRPLGPKEIRRISNFLSKNVLTKDIPYAESCEALQFAAMGGVEMMKWANDKVKELKGDD